MMLERCYRLSQDRMGSYIDPIVSIAHIMCIALCMPSQNSNTHIHTSELKKLFHEYEEWDKELSPFEKPLGDYLSIYGPVVFVHC